MKQLRVLAAVAIVTLAFTFILFVWHRKQFQPPPANDTKSLQQRHSIAVLPLQNMNGDSSIDYLRFALADELTSVLSYSRYLEVRPSSVTSKYVAPDLDPRKVGGELRVGLLVQGHYIKQGDRLTVTLEALDSATDRLLWHASISEKADNLIGLQKQLSAQLESGLFSVLEGGETLQNASRPKNQEAYDFYLRSVALPHDPKPNKGAIQMLEWSVGIDPTYAPAWEALGQRYSIDSAFGGGGEGLFQRSNNALARAVALDPNRVKAATFLITNLVERAELRRAYNAAIDLVRRRPESADAHFGLSYVLRYAGMLPESIEQCKAARQLDPGNFSFRSCAWSFLEMGETDQAIDYVRLDPGTEWAAWVTSYVDLAAGNVTTAHSVAKNMGRASSYHRELMESCTEKRTHIDFGLPAEDVLEPLGHP